MQIGIGVGTNIEVGGPKAVAERRPESFGSQLKIWIDATDSSTVFEASSNTAEDQDTVAIWSTKSPGVSDEFTEATAKPTYVDDGSGP